MWSRRHFTESSSANLSLLERLFKARQKTTRVIDNLAAIALPLRRDPLNPVQ